MPAGQIVNVDRQTALNYLHGDAIVLPADAPIGPVTIAYEGHPLGPAKNLGKRCNNLYPKNKRIRMDIR
jgi:NOL1/NOP2/fmu family ribosome biogenesis protein